MIKQSLEQLALAHHDCDWLRRSLHKALRRGDGQYGIGIDWLRKEHRLLLPERQRYCVAIFQWREGAWHRVRRLTGPRRLEQIQNEVERYSRQLGHPIITDI